VEFFAVDQMWMILESPPALAPPGDEMRITEDGEIRITQDAQTRVTEEG
jgi:hypothetical protein